MADLRARVYDADSVIPVLKPGVGLPTIEQLVSAEVAARVSQGTTLGWEILSSGKTLRTMRGYEVTGLSRVELPVPNGQNGDLIAVYDRGSGFDLTCPLPMRSGEHVTGVGGLVRSQMTGTCCLLRRMSSDWFIEVLNGFVEVA